MDKRRKQAGAAPDVRMNVHITDHIYWQCVIELCSVGNIHTISVHMICLISYNCTFNCNTILLVFFDRLEK